MLRLRKGIWYADISVGNARSVKSCFTADKKLAHEYHDNLKVGLWRSAKLGEQFSRTWNDAEALWLKEKAHKRSLGDDIEKLAWLRPLLKEMPLADINRQAITKILDKKTQQASPTTANRLLALIRAVMRLAQAHEMVSSIPSFTGLHKQEADDRVVYLNANQAARVRMALPAPIQRLFDFAVATGLRKHNVTHLEWSCVDLPRRCAWVKSTAAKGGKSIAVPLNDLAFKTVSAVEPKGWYTHVFVDAHGKPYAGGKLSKALDNALLTTGVAVEIQREFGVKFRWHDLRHTWASWHVMDGTPLDVLQKLGGWSSYKLVQKYAHFSPEHLAKYANNARTA